MRSGKKDRARRQKYYIPFSPCVPPEFLLVWEEGHLEGPGNKKRGDMEGVTGEMARDTYPSRK